MCSIHQSIQCFFVVVVWRKKKLGVERGWDRSQTRQDNKSIIYKEIKSRERKHSVTDWRGEYMRQGCMSLEKTVIESLYEPI